MPTYKYHKQYSKEKAPSLAVDAQLLKRLTAYLRPYRYWIALCVLFLIASKAMEAVIPILMGQAMQSFLNGRLDSSVEQNLLLGALIHQTIFITGLMLLVYIIDAFSVVIKTWVGQKGIFNMRTAIFLHIQQLPLAYFDRHSVGTLMTRTIHDVDQINAMFSECVIPIFGSLLLFLGIGVGIFWIDWQLALLTLSILPIVWLLTRTFRLQQRRCYEIIRTIVSAMNSFIQEHLMGLSIIRNFNLQARERNKFREINDDHCTAYLETIKNFSFFISSIDFLQNIVLTLLFAGLLLFAPVETGFQAGTFFTFSLYVMMFFRPLADLAERYNILQSAMAAAGRIFHILDQPAEPSQNGSPTAPLSALLDDAAGQTVQVIAFEGVWFAYEGENWILKNVSFTLSHGESLALVGTTGAGKTSIMSLLLRFYDIQKGAITINGKDIRDYPLTQLRNMFSIVLQDPVIYSDSLADNISLYNPAITQDNIESAIDYVSLRATVERFPDKSRHALSEKGGSLSAGEMQLVALARAVAHERSVLILDEATANIDTRTEKIIQETLLRILSHRTSLVIAHRISTIQHVSRIIVLHHGEIKEMGSHQELLQRKGIYEKLYRLQFSN